MTPSSLRSLRVALVHYWLLRRRGGEQVLEALARIFPQADIFTLIADPTSLQEPLSNRRIYTSFLQNIPGIRRHYQKFLPLFPLALEGFNLDDYDLVISSESGPAKGVITGTRSCHVCYCHTPMRYLWDMHFDYLSGVPGGKLGRASFSLISHYLRLWDQATASRVDHFLANSHNVANRIWKTYRRSAEVIYPPVAVNRYSIASGPGEFYLVVGQLLRYKRVDLAVAACNRLQRRLVVIGEGEDLTHLRRLAGPTVTIMGWQPDEVVMDYYKKCRALVFPGEEDFGLTPIEAQASGRPVVAFGQGGVLESVRGYVAGKADFSSDCTGIFFQQQSVDSLILAIEEFEKNEKYFSPQLMRRNAQRFEASRFTSEILDFLCKTIGEFSFAKDHQRESISVE